MNRKPVILPYDGFGDKENLFREIARDLDNPGITELLSFLKFNDAVFIPDVHGPGLMWFVWQELKKRNLQDQIGIFLDLKLADTSGTLKNIAKHFASYQQSILTVRSSLSGKGYLEIRRTLPGVKIALVSFLTDNSEQDCLEQYGLFPEEKILHDMRIAQKKYARLRQKEDPEFAFDMVVSSPNELAYLQRNEIPLFGRRFEKITPGIRDKWMAKGQQERISGVAQALLDGANFVVMGSQMKNGNPANGISAQESQALTKAEIEKAFQAIND
ncbi:MAG: orotidine 5'-phosphate decarboxylase / HUMPS family protein [Candidatus Moraniibacteriota bacterium]